MSGLDIILVVIVALSVGVGIKRGLIREALSIISWTLALWAAVVYVDQLIPFVAQYLPGPELQMGIAFVIIFIVSLFLLTIASSILYKLIMIKAIKGPDRILGAGFGVLRAILLVAVCIIIARGIELNNSDFWRASRLISYFNPTADLIGQLLPQVIAETPLN